MTLWSFLPLDDEFDSLIQSLDAGTVEVKDSAPVSGDEEFDSLIQSLDAGTVEVKDSAPVSGDSRFNRDSLRQIENFQGTLAKPSKVGCSTSSFKTVDKGDIKRLIAKNENVNTSHSTATWVRRFQRWAEERGIQQEMKKSIPPGCLDSILQRFMLK